MGHIHSIYDTDYNFTIDPVTRMITNQASRKTTLMQNDHQSERFTFSMPRKVEGHDMRDVSKVEIHYINVSSYATEQMSDIYEVDDLDVSPDDDETIIFSWLISGNATKYAGSLSFLIRFVCLTGDVIDYAWHTAIFKGIQIAQGMNNSAAVVELWADAVEAWKNTVKQGASAYEIAVKNGFDGSEAEWLASLKGEQGKQGIQGLQGLRGEQGLQGLQGLSAYDLAVKNGFEGTEAEWLATLPGEPGTPGADGMSAYQLAVKNGYKGTEEEWLASVGDGLVPNMVRLDEIEENDKYFPFSSMYNRVYTHLSNGRCDYGRYCLTEGTTPPADPDGAGFTRGSGKYFSATSNSFSYNSTMALLKARSDFTIDDTMNTYASFVEESSNEKYLFLNKTNGGAAAMTFKYTGETLKKCIFETEMYIDLDEITLTNVNDNWFMRVEFVDASGANVWTSSPVRICYSKTKGVFCYGGSSIPIPLKEWFSLRIEQVGTRIAVICNGLLVKAYENAAVSSFGGAKFELRTKTYVNNIKVSLDNTCVHSNNESLTSESTLSSVVQRTKTGHVRVPAFTVGEEPTTDDISYLDEIAVPYKYLKSVEDKIADDIAAKQPLILLGTMKLPTTIDNVIVGYPNSYNLEYFNRMPAVGDVFAGAGLATNDNMTFHYKAKVTGFAENEYGKFAAFELIDVVHTTHTATATKATQDGNGNVITETYATKTALADYAPNDELETVKSNVDTQAEVITDIVNGAMITGNAEKLCANEDLNNTDLFFECTITSGYLVNLPQSIAKNALYVISLAFTDKTYTGTVFMATFGDDTYISAYSTELADGTEYYRMSCNVGGTQMWIYNTEGFATGIFSKAFIRRIF